MDEATSRDAPDSGAADRRSFLGTTSSIAMIAGLGAGYGTFFTMAGRFLFPAGPDVVGWMFLTRPDAMRAGDSMTYTAPNGATVVVARQAEHGNANDFIALSSTCPHLGCKVHWETVNDRFFCPCHNGTFDRLGKGTGGPPGDAKQSLPRYPLRIENGLLFIQVPLESFASGGTGDTGTGAA